MTREEDRSGAGFDGSQVTAGQAWCLRPHRNRRIQNGRKEKVVQGSVCLNNATVWVVGSVWNPQASTECTETPTIESVRTWMAAGQLIVVLASAGIFPIRQAIVPRYTMLDLGCAEVVVGGTHKTCRNNCSLSGTRASRNTARMSTNACFGVMTQRVSLALVTTTWRPLVRLPKRFPERGGGWQGALSNRDARRGTDQEPCLQDGVLGAPMVQSDAVGACSAGDTCHPVKCAMSALANTDHPPWRGLVR